MNRAHCAPQPHPHSSPHAKPPLRRSHPFAWTGADVRPIAPNCRTAVRHGKVLPLDGLACYQAQYGAIRWHAETRTKHAHSAIRPSASAKPGICSPGATICSSHSAAMGPGCTTCPKLQSAVGGIDDRPDFIHRYDFASDQNLRDRFQQVRQGFDDFPVRVSLPATRASSRSRS